MDKENPQTSDDMVHVKIAFDLKTSQCTLSSKCPTVMLLGIIETAKSIVIQQQVMATLKAMAARPQIVPATADMVRPA